MSQREAILKMLQDAGPRGVHSFELYEAHLPRAAARVHELRLESYPIQSKHETLHGDAEGVRYTLVGSNVGSALGPRSRRSSQDASVASSESVASGAKGSREAKDTPPVDSLETRAQPSVKAPGGTPARPSLLDWDADWNAA